MNITKVKIDDREVLVRKLPLKDYAEAFKLIQSIAKHVSDADNITNEVFLERLPIILKDALPEAIKVIALASDLEEKDAELLGLDEAVNIFVAIFEVNNYGNVINTLKKVMAQRTKVKK